MKKAISTILMLGIALPACTYAAKRDVRAIGLEALKNGRIPSTKVVRDFTKIRAGARYAPDRLLVRFAPNADWSLPTRAEKDRLLSALGGSVSAEYDLVPGLTVVKLAQGHTVNAEILRRFNGPQRILYAEPDYFITLAATPNDPCFAAEQWALDDDPDGADVDAPEAWDYATGSDQIVVAVIDTGVDYNHQDLIANMWTDNGVHGYDFFNGDSDPMDDHNHGTHVAGIIGAVGNNAQGIAGVCWKVKIMALKFIGWDGVEWAGSTMDAVYAIQYAVEEGAHVINASWGGGDPNQPLIDAINGAGQANLLFVAAAGNEENDNDNDPCYPSSYDCANIISVLATTPGPGLWWYSNYGATTVDLGAPGAGIYSCLIGNNYGSMTGTSMAAPHVSGACALLWSVNPSLSYQQVKDIILQNTVRIVPLWDMCVTEGILNLHDAVTDARVDDNSQAHVWATTLRDSQLVDTAWLDARGNLVLDGPLHRQSACDLTNFRGFKVRNGGSVIALLDADSGEMFIAGQCNENVDPLNPVNARLVVKASNGDALAYIDDSGNLHLAGEVFESMWE